MNFWHGFVSRGFVSDSWALLYYIVILASFDRLQIYFHKIYNVFEDFQHANPIH